MTTANALARRLGLGDAVFIGLGSMIGAGIFAAFTPAAQAAGNGLLVGLAVAALVAFCNATSSAQLAAVHPTSGGTYIYGRRQLGEWWGFLAGWSFVVGKTASCAAMALTFATYVAPDGWRGPVALAAVLVVAAVNYFGVTRTATLTRLIVVVVLIALAVAVAAGITTGLPRLGDVDGGSLVASGPYGILQSAGLLFFAFAGYARIATMGEEVRDPAHTIPRAITIALLVAAVLYLLVALVELGTLGARGTASAAAPLTEVVAQSGWGWAGPVLRIGAAAASLGALLALVAGVGRTTLAMAREGDLPGWLSAVHPRFRVPYRAEIVLAIVVGILVLTVDLRGVIGFSSFGVLVYYLVANLAAVTQRADVRRYPRALQVIGIVGCATLVATLPWLSIAVGVGVLVVGAAYRLVRLRTSA